MSSQIGADVCDCGQHQAVNRIADVCLLAKFGDGLQLVHSVEDDALDTYTQTTALSFLFYSFFIDKPPHCQSLRLSWCTVISCICRKCAFS